MPDTEKYPRPAFPWPQNPHSPRKIQRCRQLGHHSLGNPQSIPIRLLLKLATSSTERYHRHCGQSNNVAVGLYA